MPKQIFLTRAVVKLLHAAVDKLYDRVKVRFLEKHPPVDKRIVIGFKPRVTLPSLFRDAAREEGAKPSEDVLQSLLRVADGFLEAQRHTTKTHVVKAVQSFLNEAQAAGVETDVETVLGGELARVFGRAADGVKRILQTEATTARNVGTLEGIVRVGAALGEEDPVVYWVVVRDQDLCQECKNLHLLPDEKTPRVWRLSEVKHGYHKKGEDQPSLSGGHVNCRCFLVSLQKGYGFDDGGGVTFVSLDHDEFARQRK
jgi:hypothetical protein